jgi:hypothetical protein
MGALYAFRLESKGFEMRFKRVESSETDAHVGRSADKGVGNRVDQFS